MFLKFYKDKKIEVIKIETLVNKPNGKCLVFPKKGIEFYIDDKDVIQVYSEKEQEYIKAIDPREKIKRNLTRKLVRTRDKNFQSLIIAFSLSGEQKDRISKNKESLLEDINIILNVLDEVKKEIELEGNVIENIG